MDTIGPRMVLKKSGIESNRPQISVIVPITKMSGRLKDLTGWIPEAIDLGFQIVLVHDVQDHSTKSELQNLLNAHNGPQVELLEGQFGNPGSARNAGMKLARGRWITFWDADDSPKPSKYLDAILETDSRNIKVIIGGFEVINQKTGESIRISRPPINQDRSIEYFAKDPGIWRCIFDTDLVKSTQFSQARMGEDIGFLSEVTTLEPALKFVEEVLYRYHSNVDGQLTQTANFVEEMSKTLVELERLMKIKGKHQKFRTIVYSKSALALIRKSKGLGRFKFILQFLKTLVMNFKLSHQIVFQTTGLIFTEYMDAITNYCDVLRKRNRQRF